MKLLHNSQRLLILIRFELSNSEHEFHYMALRTSNELFFTSSSVHY